MEESKELSVIDIDQLENKDTISNSEYILSIMEICINSSKYNLPTSNSTRNFWEEVVNSEKLVKIFKLFKSETLRKYWRILRDINQNKNTIQIVRANAKLIDNPNYKLLPIINCVANYIKSKSKDFDKYFDNFVKSKPIPNSLHKSIKSKEDNDIKLTKSKRKMPKGDEENLEQDIINLNKKIKEKNEREEKEKEQKNKAKDDITLEEIIKTFQEYFTDKGKEEIYQVLYKTSGNLKNAYLVLDNEVKYEDLIFEDTDDYILKNCKEQKYYTDLIKKKGKENVEERERFLKLNTNKANKKNTA